MRRRMRRRRAPRSPSAAGFAAAVAVAWAAVAAVAVPLAAPHAAHAKVYLSLEDGLRLAFGDSLRVETRTAYPTAEQQAAVRERAQAPFDAARVTYHAGVDAGGAPRLYAYLDTHTVRTMTETALIVLDPAGTVQRVEVLSFHEPQDYAPPARWLALLAGRRPDPGLRPGEAIPNLTGATLTARALAEAVRRAHAFQEIVVRGRP